MKLLGIPISALLLAALGLPIALASYPAADSPEAAFAKLKGLSGEWESKAPDGNSHVTYEVVSAGSAVVERFVSDKLGHDSAMVTVYYLDGNRLLLQHYCMAKNQPRMQAASFDPATGVLRFTFLDATGLASPADGHMDNATFHFLDANHLEQEWQFVENGKPKFTESLQYTRVR